MEPQLSCAFHIATRCYSFEASAGFAGEDRRSRRRRSAMNRGLLRSGRGPDPRCDLRCRRHRRRATDRVLHASAATGCDQRGLHRDLRAGSMRSRPQPAFRAAGRRPGIGRPSMATRPMTISAMLPNPKRLRPLADVGRQPWPSADLLANGQRPTQDSRPSHACHIPVGKSALSMGGAVQRSGRRLQ